MLKKMVFLVLLAAAHFNVNAQTLNFGNSVDKSLLVNISTLLASPDEYLDKTITVSGTIVGVCSHRGCWVDLASDARFEKLRIKVRDGDMVFPMHTKGRKALATGKLQAIQLSLAQTKQYKASLAKRQGKSLNTDEITEAMAIYQLSPEGVSILE